MFKKLTFKQKLFTGFGLLTLLVAVAGTVIFTISKRTIEVNKLLSSTVSLDNLVLNMRKSEKDFLMRDVTNEEFYKTGNSNYVISFKSRLLETSDLAESLERNSFINKFSLNDKITEIENHINKYNEVFIGIVELTKKKGFFHS